MLFFSIWYELLSQIYRGKTSDMSQAWNHVFVNVRHNSFQTEGDWCEWWTKMAANLNVFKTSKKKLHFIQIELFFRKSSLGDI